MFLCVYQRAIGKPRPGGEGAACESQSYCPRTGTDRSKVRLHTLTHKASVPMGRQQRQMTGVSGKFRAGENLTENKSLLLSWIGVQDGGAVTTSKPRRRTRHRRQRRENNDERCEQLACLRDEEPDRLNVKENCMLRKPRTGRSQYQFPERKKGAK